MGVGVGGERVDPSVVLCDFRARVHGEASADCGQRKCNSLHECTIIPLWQQIHRALQYKYSSDYNTKSFIRTLTTALEQIVCTKQNPSEDPSKSLATSSI